LLFPIEVQAVYTEQENSWSWTSFLSGHFLRTGSSVYLAFPFRNHFLFSATKTWRCAQPWSWRCD